MSVRLANVNGRASVLIGACAADVERTSKGRFASDPMAALQQWPAFLDWAHGLTAAAATEAEMK